MRLQIPQLERACNLRLSYVRPMSGGAHVLRMHTDAAENAIACLRAQPGVVYVQQDHLAKPTEAP